MQTSLLKTQLKLEDIYSEIARNESKEIKRPSVVLCDRGILDGSAYVSEDVWSQIMDEQGIDGHVLADKRYDAVMHMVTAAEGAEEFYDFSNEARYENIEEARARDAALRHAYLGHKKYFIVDNKHGNFQDKINRSIKLI
jgi:hypothetical protein